MATSSNGKSSSASPTAKPCPAARTTKKWASPALDEPADAHRRAGPQAGAAHAAPLRLQGREGNHGQGVFQHGRRLVGRRVRRPHPQVSRGPDWHRGQRPAGGRRAGHHRGLRQVWRQAYLRQNHRQRQVRHPRRRRRHALRRRRVRGPRVPQPAPGPPPLRRPQGAVRKPEPARHGGRRPHSRLRRLRQRDDARQVRGEGAQQGAGRPHPHLPALQRLLRSQNHSRLPALRLRIEGLCHAAGVD